MVRIPLPRLQRFAVELLQAGGASPEEAATVGASLVRSDAMGYASHGVMRIPFYLDMLQRGDLVSDAPLELLARRPSAIAADGGWGFGQVQMGRLLELAIESAAAHGIVVATLRHSGHIGRLGEYVERAARNGLLAHMMVNTHGAARRVAPPGGTEPRLGTNPIAFGVPHELHPIVLDFSTSATAEGKVRVHRIAGTPCPPGWLLDADGRPTTDPNVLYEDPPGTILPFGGEQAYKGFGLSLMVEFFAGALSGGLCAREQPITPKGNCVMLLLIDPDALGGSAHFAAQASSLVEFVRGCKVAEPGGEVLLPGDPERRRLARAEDVGVSIDESSWQRLVHRAAELGVATPSPNG